MSHPAHPIRPLEERGAPAPRRITHEHTPSHGDTSGGPAWHPEHAPSHGDTSADPAWQPGHAPSAEHRVEPRVSPYMKWLGLGAALLVLVPLGVRVQVALKKQAAITTERARTADAAKSVAGAPLSVKVVLPEARSYTPTVALEGTVHASLDADLAFKATGTLSAVFVKVGDAIEKGKPLATLDATETAAQSRAAGAQQKAAEAQLLMAQDSDKRTRLLFQRGAAAEAHATAAASQLSLAQAQVEAARAQLALTGALLQNYTMRAPFAGTVTRAPTTPGALVVAGVPVFHLQNASALRLVGTIGEADAELVVVGAEARLEGGHVATVTAVLPSVEPATRRVPIEAVLDNAELDGARRLRSGEFVRATITTKDAVDALAIPGSALRPGSQDEVVVVVDGKAKLVRVRFARDASGTLFVQGGLDKLARVVLAPPAELADGTVVTAAEQPASPASPASQAAPAAETP